MRRYVNHAFLFLTTIMKHTDLVMISLEIGFFLQNAISQQQKLEIDEKEKIWQKFEFNL